MAIVHPAVEAYAEAHTTPEPPHLVALAEETRASTSSPGMMVGPVEGRFLAMLVHLAQAERILEIGTFTGYSALTMAEALPPGGRIVTCEVDPEHAAIARRHVEASPHADRIEIRLGRAIDTVRILEGPFDLVFIDADKPSYPAYYEATLPLLSARGLMILDNVLWRGEVADPGTADPDARALAALNEQIRKDPRVECVMLTVRDGMTLVRRRPTP